MESYEKLRKEFDDYIETSREIETELERSLHEAEKYSTDLAKKKSALEEKLVLLQEKVTANTKDDYAKQSEIDKLKERLEQAAVLKKQFECSNDELDEKVRRLQSTEEDLLHRLETSEENYILLQGEIEELKSATSNPTLEQEALEHKEMAEVLEMELDELKQQHKELESQNDELSEELSRLTDELVANHQATFTLQARLDEEHSARLALEAEKSALQEQLLCEKNASALSIEELKNNIINLKIDIENCSQKNNTEAISTETISRLKSELELSRSEITRLVVEKENLSKEISLLNNESKALSEEIVILSQRATKGDRTCDELKSKQQAEMYDLNSKLVAKDDELKRLQAELNEKSSTEMLLVNRSSELKDTISDLQAQLSAARAADASQGGLPAGDDDAQEEIIRALEEKVFDLTTKIEAYERSEKQSPLKVSKAAYTANMIHQEEEKKVLRITIEKLERELVTYRNSLREVRKLDEKLKDDSLMISSANLGLSSIRTSVEQVVASRDFDGMKDELLRQLDRYDIIRKSNAKLLQKIQAVTGNIQVCCRTRPMSEAETANKEKLCIDFIDDCELVCFDRRADQWRSFVFDRAWNLGASQADVFCDIEPIVLSVVEGFNTCLFAYGQTGSGKTFTMNDSKEWGVAYRTMQKIFETIYLKKSQSEEQMARLRDCKAGTTTNNNNNNNNNNISSLDDSILSQSDPFTFSVSVSMMEIYNEQVFDLLVDSTALNQTGLEIRQSPEGGVSVPGLRQVPVACLNDVMKVFSKGSSNRATGSTNLNEHSSRSHSILQVDVCTTTAGAAPLKSKLFLVDLAGSERVGKSGVTGAAMKEAQHINKSLSALGDVMEALDVKAKHVPYRNSKLTYLLQDALGGNSRTMMIVTICPTEVFVDETLFTLQFATRIRNISLGSAKKNVSSKNLEEALKTVKIELRDLKKRKMLSDETVNELRRENKRLGDKLSSSAEHKQRSMDEAKKNVEVHVQQLTKNNQDINSKYHEEREAKALLSQELDAAKVALRKAQDQVREIGKEKEKLLISLKQKENEIEQLARHATPTPNHSAPLQNAHTNKTASTAATTTTNSGRHDTINSSSSSNGVGGYGARAQIVMRQRSNAIPPSNPDVAAVDDSSSGTEEVVGGGEKLSQKVSLIPVRSPSVGGTDATVTVGDGERKYSSRLRISASTALTSSADHLNSSISSLRSTKVMSHRHSIDNSFVSTFPNPTTKTVIPAVIAPSTAASAVGSSRAREALLRHQERMHAHREKLTSKRPSQFPV